MRKFDIQYITSISMQHKNQSFYVSFERFRIKHRTYQPIWIINDLFKRKHRASDVRYIRRPTLEHFGIHLCMNLAVFSRCKMSSSAQNAPQVHFRSLSGGSAVYWLAGGRCACQYRQWLGLARDNQIYYMTQLCVIYFIYANCFIGDVQYGAVKVADRSKDCKNVRFDAFVGTTVRVGILIWLLFWTFCRMKCFICLSYIIELMILVLWYDWIFYKLLKILIIISYLWP